MIFAEIVDYLSIIGAVEVWFAIILQAFCIHDIESEATPFVSNGVKKLDYDSTIARENSHGEFQTRIKKPETTVWQNNQRA